MSAQKKSSSEGTVHSQACCASKLFDLLIIDPTYYYLCFSPKQASCFSVVSYIRGRAVARLFRLVFENKQWREETDNFAGGIDHTELHKWSEDEFIFKDKKGRFSVLNRREFLRIIPLLVQFEDPKDYVRTCETCKQIDLIEDSSETDESSEDEDEPAKKRPRKQWDDNQV